MFQNWWQGLIFGVVTTVGMLAVANALAVMWKKYEGANEGTQRGCDAHSHH